jgi:hypothetical protein
MIMREMMAQAFGVGEVLRFARALSRWTRGCKTLGTWRDSTLMRAASGTKYFSIKDETGGVSAFSINVGVPPSHSVHQWYERLRNTDA